MLTVDDLRQHLETTLADEALERLLGAAYEAIDTTLGAGGDITELITAGPGDLLLLSRDAYAVVAVTEDTVALATDDYRLVGGQTLLRLGDGTNPATRWRGRVEVTYSPHNDEATRDRVAIALVQLDMDHQPGLTSQKLGDWSETYAAGSDTYTQQRQAILASLTPSHLMLI